mgnify:CR=1 FL=1
MSYFKIDASGRQPNVDSQQHLTNYTKPYLQQKLSYTEDGRLLDENGLAVMMEWEEYIMMKQAETVTQYGGRVLNVGFGMGLIDSYIQKNGVDEHWIIEPHPDVCEKIIKDGWLKKPNTRILFSRWQEVLEHLPKFDGIYIDTWNEDLTPFFRYVPELLKPGGVMTFFNNPRSDEDGLHMMQHEYDCFKDWADIQFESFEIPHISSDEDQRGDGLSYWKQDQKIYWNPSIRFKRN